MKKYIVLTFLLLSVKAFAQNFEGSIKWSLKMEITDPQRKAQMEAAQKKMNDPASQARMREMQAKMNDPQFKSMMEGNPQLKAQIEKMIADMQQGGDLSSMMPKELIAKIKDQNSLVKMEGGVFSSEILYLKNNDQTYSIDRKNKTYSVLSAPAKSEKVSNLKYKVTKTSEKTKILNHLCTKYIVDATEGDVKKMTQYIWATTEVNFDLKALAKQRVGNSEHRLFYEEIDGLPLKTEMKLSQADITMEAKEIKQEPLDANQFIIPADFKEVSAPTLKK